MFCVPIARVGARVGRSVILVLYRYDRHIASCVSKQEEESHDFDSALATPLDARS